MATSQGGGGAVQHGAGGGVVVGGEVDQDRDLAAVEEPVADAVVLLDVMECVGPSARAG